LRNTERCCFWLPQFIFLSTTFSFLLAFLVMYFFIIYLFCHLQYSSTIYHNRQVFYSLVAITFSVLVISFQRFLFKVLPITYFIFKILNCCLSSSFTHLLFLLLQFVYWKLYFIGMLKTNNIKLFLFLFIFYKTSY